VTPEALFSLLQMQNLKALTKSSAKVATFAVRLTDGGLETYTYLDKKGQEITAHKFEVFLVGNKSDEYCKGYVKGNSSECIQAAGKCKDGTVWALSKVAFDTYTQAQYISTPVPFRVDLSKSVMTIQDEHSDVGEALQASMPSSPSPPTSVADVARITTNRSIDVIAVIKEVDGKTRRSKSDEMIADIVLVDNTMGDSGKLALIDVSVFGQSKIEQLKAAVGTPMAFFNLSITKDKHSGKPNITHYSKAKIVPAPDCQKTVELRQKAEELQKNNDTEQLTQLWEPTQSMSRDVSGLQSMSCAAFLDYTTETPQATVPDVNQTMWTHIEEPAPSESIFCGDRIWFRTQLMDSSCNVTVGIPQRCALLLANVPDQQTFQQKHVAGELNFPLLCHARVSRSIREVEAKDGASQPVAKTKYVNHQVETVEPVTWNLSSAPNASYTGILTILNNCPPNEEGIAFACLEDLQPDPFCEMRICYGGSPGQKAVLAATLVASNRNSKTVPIGNDAFKVVTEGVKDMANSAGSATEPVGDHTLVGYCTLDHLPAFRLDPPRGKDFRVALVLISKVDDEGFHVHKSENIEPDQVDNAIQCMQRLRRLSKQIRPKNIEKRSHKLTLDTSSLKKARTLQSVPTDASLPDDLNETR